MFFFHLNFYYRHVIIFRLHSYDTFSFGKITKHVIKYISLSKKNPIIFLNIYVKRDMVCVISSHSTIPTCSVGALLAYSSENEVFDWQFLSHKISTAYETDPIFRPYFALNSFQCFINVLKTVSSIASQYYSSVFSR